MICDAASIAVMVERIGCNNSRWRRIKRSDFIETLDDRDILNQEMEVLQDEALQDETIQDEDFLDEEARRAENPTR